MSLIDTQIDPANEPDHIRELRARAEAGTTATTERDQLAREVEFLRLGVDTTSLLGQNVMAQHGAGPLTADTVAATLKTVRAALGMPDDTPPNPGDGVTPGSPEAQLQQMQQQSQGGLPPVTPPPAVKAGSDQALDDFHEALARGESREDALERGIGRLIVSGMQGDASTKYDSNKWDEERKAYGHGAELSHLDDTKLVQNPLPPSQMQQLRRQAEAGG